MRAVELTPHEGRELRSWAATKAEAAPMARMTEFFILRGGLELELREVMSLVVMFNSDG